MHITRVFSFVLVVVLLGKSNVLQKAARWVETVSWCGESEWEVLQGVGVKEKKEEASPSRN